VEPRCAAHPDRPAAGTCQRCGAFACGEDLREVAGKVLCGSCAARPDADYLEAFRLRYWGRRDAFAWTWAATLPLFIAWMAGGFLARTTSIALFNLAVAAAGTAYVLGPTWARGLVFVLPASSLACATSVAFENQGPADGAGRTGAFLACLLAAAPPLLIAVAVYRDGRSQLFFKVPLSRERLQKAWDLHANNGPARTGFILSLAGLTVPGLSLVGLALSIYGLTRVDPAAHPPIGRRARAVAGIVFGAVGIRGWAAFVGFYAYASSQA
jgi:hypothetical protein